MVIIQNALRERIRRKELYIVIGIACLLLFLCGSGAATLSIDGIPITDFDNMFGVMHVISSFASCVLALVMSLRTIPNEYERRTSHLVWIRNVPQSKYHLCLASANAISACMSVAVFYLGMAVYTIAKGRADCLIRMIPAFLILCINVVLISTAVSMLSITLPSFAVGTVGLVYVLAGTLHGVLDVYKSVIGGFSGGLVKALLWITPDLNGIQTQARNLVMGKTMNFHCILAGLLTVYIFSLGFFLIKRKEA